MDSIISRDVTGEEIDRYEKDGVIMLKSMLDENWIELLDKGLNRSRTRPTDRAHVWDRDEDNREMYYDTFAWRDIPEYRHFIEESPCAELAGLLMGADKVNFFFDAVFCRSPGSQFRTPWHQDEPYWSINGFQTCTVWIPLVPVAAQSALSVVPGSHRWGNRYLQEDFGKFNPDGRDKVPHSDFSMLADAVPMPDIDKEAGTCRSVSFDMVPGDILVFNGRSIHGGSGQLAGDQELRVFTAKWCGDDVRVAFKDWGMDPDYSVEMTEAGLKPGDQLSTGLYPIIWER